MELARVDEAEVTLAAFERAAGAAGDAEGSVMALARHAMLAVLRGRFDTGAALAEEFAARARRVGLPDAERLTMALHGAVLTEAEWRRWDQAHNVKGKSLGRLAADGHWLMDGLDPARYATLIHLVPAPVRIVIIKGYAGRYRAECARRWGPGIAVGPAAAAPPAEKRPEFTHRREVRPYAPPADFVSHLWRIR